MMRCTVPLFRACRPTSKRLWALTGCVLALLLSVSPSRAAVSNQQAERLNQYLTPFGAIRSGNASGTIPPWTGGDSELPAGYQGSGHHHIDPYPDDRAQYRVDADNLERYRAIVGEGVAAMIRAYPATFRLEVYPSRRPHTAPDSVVRNTRRNAESARLVSGGNGIDGAYGGIPFPVLSGSNSDRAIQAMWNHMTRWRGFFMTRTASDVAVTGNGRHTPVTLRQELAFNFYNPTADAESLDNILSYYLSTVTEPRQFAGGGILVHDPLNQVIESRKAWGFNAGQRTVRRAPSLAYDAPIATAANLRTVDDTGMFNGALDRYNWHYLGLEEKLIPYNNYRIGAAGQSRDDILEDHHLNAGLLRWELHRVHVVEATLREGARHIYRKRRFYLDEDSWNIAMVDQYDNDGRLWRVSLALLKNFYDLPGVWSDVEVFHDLKEQGYNVQGLPTEQSGSRLFSDTVPDSRYFSPANLRRRFSH